MPLPVTGDERSRRQFPRRHRGPTRPCFQAKACIFFLAEHLETLKSRAVHIGSRLLADAAVDHLDALGGVRRVEDADRLVGIMLADFVQSSTALLYWLNACSTAHYRMIFSRRLRLLRS